MKLQNDMCNKITFMLESTYIKYKETWHFIHTHITAKLWKIAHLLTEVNTAGRAG